MLIEYDSNRSVLSGARIIQFNCNNPKYSWQTWIRDYKNNIHYNTSFNQLKLKKQIWNKNINNQQIDNIDIDNTCNTNTDTICIEKLKCHHAHQWREWKPIVTLGFYQHWFKRRFIDLMDLFFRALIVIEEYLGYPLIKT